MENIWSRLLEFPRATYSSVKRGKRGGSRRTTHRRVPGLGALFRGLRERCM